jgi:tetratricopeptide (TPR) repeat protein/DNA-directed RNA polymerase specialized sigma24 family protein
MKLFLAISLLPCVLFSNFAHGQTDFKAGWEKADPAPPGSGLGIEEKLTAHTAFLNEATKKKNTLHELYGLLYLFYDELDRSDPKEATRYLLEAESLATASGNAGWQGAVSYRRGVLYMGLQRFTDAMDAYRSAVSLCRAAGDSLCLGLALEQLGATYGIQDHHQRSDSCYLRAFPLIEAYGTEAALCAGLNNFGGLLIRQERPNEAIPYLDRAIAISLKNSAYDVEASALNNLSEAYFMLNRYDDALATLDRCVVSNKAHGLADNLIANYQGLASVYQATGDLPKALLFTAKHYELRDSLLGARTQLDVADLEDRYQSQQKKLALLKSETELAASNLLLTRGAWLLCSIVLLAGAALWRWRLQVKQAREGTERNKISLNELTGMLLDKNTRISDLEEQLAAPKPPETTLEPPPQSDPPGKELPPVPPALEPEPTFYNQRILTDEDWALFKQKFERVYPGFMMRLRSAFPDLSNAEERLVLFIKLNLNTKESAAILGISTDSVKKGRNRLRKRLQLAEEVDLDAFIRTF